MLWSSQPWRTTRSTQCRWFLGASSSATALRRRTPLRGSSPSSERPYINEDVTITILELAVDPINCPQVANAIHSFLVNTLCLRNIHIGPSTLGVATVTFDSCLDHQVAMGAPHRMEPYWLSFIPHDAGANLCHLPLDRTCWIMLVNFPLDYLSEARIAASLNSFGNLLHGHESSNKAR
jgi:hypothetical protein